MWWGSAEIVRHATVEEEALALDRGGAGGPGGRRRVHGVRPERLPRGTGCRCRGGQERDDADAGDAGGHPGVHGELARLPRCRRGRDPEGHFCTVRIKVRNIGGTTRTPGISFAQAFDAQSVAYLADAVAEVRADAAGASLLDELKPGAQVTAPLIYDLPATATITSLLLRESPSAPGIKIALS
ncbi:MAG TPA: DUF4352 domain-containing protein [Actinoplanes sp.]